jgi:hypothetical protein
VGKARDCLVRTAVSYGKLCAVGEIPVILLKICGTVYIQNPRTNLICMSHVNIFFERKIINFLSFYPYSPHPYGPYK